MTLVPVTCGTNIAAIAVDCGAHGSQRRCVGRSLFVILAVTLNADKINRSVPRGGGDSIRETDHYSS